LALELGRPDVTVLIGSASFDELRDLPPELHGLTTRQAFVVSDDRFEADVARLGALLQTILTPPPPPPGAHAKPTRGPNVEPSERPRRRGFWAWLRSLFGG
jgi:hypothetical protein